MSPNSRMSTRTDLTEGPIAKKLILFALPIIAGNIVMQLYNVTDSIVIGQFEGSDALAAVALSFPIMMLFNSLFMGLSMGSNIIISQYRGAKDYTALEQAVNSIFTLCIMVGGVITILGLLLSRKVLEIMGTPANIIDRAVSYIRWIFVGTIGNTVYNMSTGLTRGMGDSRWPLVALCTSATMNVFLDIFFVAVLHMGVAGVAIATAITQGCSGLILVARFALGKYGFRLSFSNMRKVNMHTVGLIFRLGIPSSIQNVAQSLGQLIIQSFANNFGSNYIAANSVVQRVDGFVMMPMMGIGMAVTTFAGQNIGAGNPDRARKGTFTGVRIILVLAICIGFLLYHYGILLMRVFTNNQVVLDMGLRGIRFIAFFFCFMGINQCVSGAVRGSGATNIPAIFAILGNLIRIPLVYILAIIPMNHSIEAAVVAGAYATRELAKAAGVGMDQYMGLFYSMGISMVIGAAMIMTYFIFGKWHTKGVVQRRVVLSED